MRITFPMIGQFIVVHTWDYDLATRWTIRCQFHQLHSPMPTVAGGGHVPMSRQTKLVEARTTGITGMYHFLKPWHDVKLSIAPWLSINGYQQLDNFPLLVASIWMFSMYFHGIPVYILKSSLTASVFQFGTWDTHGSIVWPSSFWNSKSGSSANVTVTRHPPKAKRRYIAVVIVVY